MHPTSEARGNTSKTGPGQGPLPVAIAPGHGHWPWPLAMATGHGHWPWPLAMATGHGRWPWPLAMAIRAIMAIWASDPECLDEFERARA